MVRFVSGAIDFSLEVVPVDKLLQHEQVLPQKIDTLKYVFKNWAKLEDPIIIDENFIVLDGNHRAETFKELNYKFLIACKVNYFEEKIKLRYWFRVIKDFNSTELLEDSISKIGLSYQECDSQKELSDRMNKAIGFGFQMHESYLFIPLNDNGEDVALKSYNLVEKILVELRKKQYSVVYIPDQYVLSQSDSNENYKNDLIVWTARITKKQVINTILNGEIFAPKTTRHLIPSRPLNINIPVELLKKDITLEEINARFEELLDNKYIIRFGPGQVINGRYYEEELFVFYDKE
jgi:hypothetical protein